VRRVYLASPLSGPTQAVRDAHHDYLLDALADALRRGEAVMAPHGLYPLVLDDSEPEDRARGLAAGLAWLAPSAIDAVVVYCDLGISRGMAAEIHTAEARGIPCESRWIRR